MYICISRNQTAFNPTPPLSVSQRGWQHPEYMYVCLQRNELEAEKVQRESSI
jgi:hypothetical protein